MAAGRDVSINCTVQGETMDWVVNGEYPSRKRNVKLLASGIEFFKGQRVNGVLNSRIVIPTTLNGTWIKCIAENASETLESLAAMLTIAGIFTAIKLYMYECGG